MYPQEQHYLVEKILDLMRLLQDSQMELEQLAELGERGVQALFPERADFQGACEIIQFMDEMPGGFLIYYAGGAEEIIYANRALLRLFLCDSMAEFRKLTGNSFRGLVHPEDLEPVERSIKAQVASSPHDLDYVEYRIIRRDGAVRWVEDYGHFIHSGLHRDIFYVFLGDATEKHRRQLAERASLMDDKRKGEQRLRDLIQEYDRERALINQEHLRRLEVIEGLSIDYDSIFYVDLDEDQALPYRLGFHGGLVFDEEYRMRRFSALMANYVNTWVHPEDRELFARASGRDYIREKLTGSKSFYLNFKALHGAQVQYFQMRVVNVGHQERVSQIVMGLRSVDDEIRREMEQKQFLAEALSNATRAVNARTTFLSNMSHDMRTPLNAIFGFTALAKQERGDPAAVCGYLDRVEAASRQLLDLIEKVLELSRAESGEVRPVEVDFDLCGAVQEVYDFLSPQAEEKDIAFSLDCEGVSHRAVCGDEEKLKQLLLYLVNNAVTYTKPGGRVSVAVSERETMPNQYAVYQLVVEDTGIGISEEFLAKAFEPFSREKNTTLSGIHGIGLGLTIAKNIVDMMGGVIDVKSTVGVGSTFTVTLRLRMQPQPAQDLPGGPLAAGQGRSILLVEDNEINLELETELLEDLGFSIDTAVNGSIAVEKVKAAPPGKYDLIIMDIQMPVMDGWQAAQAIRSLDDPARSRIPIVALSANVFDSDIHKSIESGMNAHLPKPLDVSKLLETVAGITR